MRKSTKLLSLLLAAFMMLSIMSACKPAESGSTLSDLTSSASSRLEQEDDNTSSDDIVSSEIASDEEKDETNVGESNKNEINKNETNKNETNKNETNKNETNKNETNKDEVKPDPEPTPDPEPEPLLTYTPIDTTGMTDLQKAIVLTGESFYLRGARAQYDMSNLITTSPYNPERRLVKQKAPEDYTSQNIGYTDCSGFVHDVYWSALNFAIVSVDSVWTQSYVNNSEYRVMRRWPVADAQDFDTPEELKAHKQEFLDKIQPGDIIVYRYKNNDGGHTMLYVGNKMMLHSSGSSYNYTDKVERYEANGTYLYDSIEETLLNPESRLYLFNKYNYAILRPLKSFSGNIPEKTLSRMEKMRGIVAEKLASHTYSQTVNPGEEVTFTFRVENYSNVDKTLSITDSVPANTTYISGAQTVIEDNLFWNITVPAGKTVEVSYKVKVKEETQVLGKIISSYGSIEEVAVNCPKIYIKNTLTVQQQKLVSAVDTLKTSELRDLALADAIYKEALGKSSLEGYTSEDVLNGVFDYVSTNFSSWPKTWKKLKTTGTFIGMLAPNLYGGKNVTEVSVRGDTANARTRMVSADKLVVGDIIVTNDTGEGNIVASTYLYLGDKLLNLSTMEETELTFLDALLGYRHFAVIRPSFAM